MAKERIAIIGGGMGGLATAFWITEKKGWQDRYEITLYQTGWRLGGKGASGRNLDANLGHRSEEHGVHVWFGLYENAFKTIRAAYEEMGPHGPFQKWSDAFKPSGEGILGERINDFWSWWLLKFRFRDGELPGDGRPLPDLFDYLVRALRWFAWNVHEFRDLERSLATPKEAPLAHRSWPRRLSGFGRRLFRNVTQVFTKAPTYLHIALKIVESLPRNPEKFLEADVQRLIEVLDKFMSDLAERWESSVLEDHECRRLLLALDLGIAAIRGVLADRVLTRGLDAIDEYDFCEWLQRHGARFASMEESAIIRGLYGIPFAFEEGNTDKPNFAAGAALRSLVRIFFGYKKAYAFRMQSGMGEIVFTPLYRVLAARGVKFEFFHHVENLGLSADGRRIEMIDVSVQAKTRDGKPYEPLIEVPLSGGIQFKCWPSEPLWDQLEAPAPITGDPGFESPWSHYQSVKKKTLKLEQDFDKVVLAVPPSVLRHVAGELVKADSRWDNMVTHIKTARTLATQVWLKEDAKGIGWDPAGRFKEEALVGAYEHPINIFMDATHIMRKTETWGTDGPGYLAYFCGPMEDDPSEPPFGDNAGYPEEERQKVMAMARDWYSKHIRSLWPDTAMSEDRDAIDWNKAFDPENRQGPDRMNGQYIRCNISPSERYVLSLKGSTEVSD